MLSVKMEDLDLPEIKRRKVQEKKAEDKKEFKDLFESDSDSDDSDGLKVKGELRLRPHPPAPRRLFLIRPPGRCGGLASRGQSSVVDQTCPLLEKQQLNVNTIQFVELPP